MLRFEHNWFLLTLVFAPVLILLFILMVRWKKNTIRKIGDEKLIRQLIADYSPKRFLFKFLLVLCAFVLTGLGVANLQYPKQAEQVQRQGVDVILVLDVSKSMLARDLRPNRLERARQLVNKLIDKLRNDRVGLVLFAGRAYLQMPLTTDHSSAKIYVNSASPESVPAQGTVIGEALTISNNAFGQKEKKYKSVILITDGEDHDEKALEAAAILSENGAILHTIGVGSPEGATLIDPVTQEQKRDAQGNVVISRLNEAMLQELAKAANGTYQHLENTDQAVNNLLEQINGMEQKSISDQSFINYRSFFQWFIAVALAFLLLDFFISERKRKIA
ncbi:MAG: VWA domain-containing protein [Chitinophagaceae bacterium]